MGFSGYKGAPGNYGAQDTSRLPSPGLWSDVDSARKGEWLEVWEDFGPYGTSASIPTTQGIVFNGKGYASSSTGPVGGAFHTSYDGGVIYLGSDGDNEGSAFGGAHGCFRLVAGAGRFIMEARVLASAITPYTALGEIFVGMLESSATLSVTVPITATAGALSDNNLVGFYRDCTNATNAALMKTTYKANGVTAVVVDADAVSVTAATWIKLGMTFDLMGDDILRFYKDGVELATTKSLVGLSAGTDFPNDVPMTWVVAAVNEGANTTYGLCDWVRVAQKPA